MPDRSLDVPSRPRHDDPVTGAVAVPYIGRAQHRAAVAAAFAEPGHVLLIRGEAGVGKSTLIAIERANAANEVLEGACLQIAGQPLALVAGETRDAELRGAVALRPEILPLPPVLTVEEALVRERYVVPPQVLRRGGHGGDHRHPLERHRRHAQQETQGQAATRRGHGDPFHHDHGLG